MPPASRRLGDLFEVAHALVRAGVPLRTAKSALDALAAGRSAYVEAPALEDFESMRRIVAAQNVALHRIEPRAVDVKALRARLGISQEAFAGRYGLDVATLRNWEQGRTTPDGPAATLLQLIERDPEKVVEMLAE